jgi:NADH-quinone oxidoreductase subunit L
MSIHWQFSLAPVTLGLLGIFSAMTLFKKGSSKADQIASSLSIIYNTIYHKFYIDEVYLFITRKVLFQLVGQPAAWFDKNVIDGLVNFSGLTTKAVSDRIRVIQSGKVQHYGLYFLFGVIGLGILLIYVTKF